MRSANNTSIFCGSMIAVTSPSPNMGCISVCPLRYVRARSYGAPCLADARRVVPARYATRDAHIGQLTRVMLPARGGEGRVRLCPALSISTRKRVCAALRDSSIVLSSVKAAALRANLVIRPSAASTATTVTAIEISSSSRLNPEFGFVVFRMFLKMF